MTYILKVKWYQVSKEWLPENPKEEFTKSKQLKDIGVDLEYVKFLESAVIKFLRTKFKLINFVYENMISITSSKEKSDKK